MEKLEKLSKKWNVRNLTEDDSTAILTLYQSNPLYFQHCPPPPSLESVREDMLRLPDGKTESDKYYLGFWEGDRLVAVMDFVYAYPDEQTVFIGLFMVHQDYQGKGVGLVIVKEALRFFSQDHQKARLACVKSNPQAEHFWRKQGFLSIGVETQEPTYAVEIMEKDLG